MSDGTSSLQPSAVAEARRRLAGIAHVTPVLTSRTLDLLSGRNVFLKCESFQRGGSFKFRGAYCTVSQMSSAERSAGVITHSSGNHAQAVALAARILGARAVVVMPDNVSSVKQRAVEAYGARIVTCPAADREKVCAQLVRDHGHSLVHPYDDERIIAGQGTAASELIDEVGALDVLLVPVGGGGLISGSALAASAQSPGCRVVGVEPERAADANRSFREGRICELGAVPDTIADGLRTRRIGDRNLSVMLRYVSDMTTVTEEEIEEALRFLWERIKVVVEPSSAVALAPLLSGRTQPEGLRIGVILSGGNVDMPNLSLARGAAP